MGEETGLHTAGKAVDEPGKPHPPGKPAVYLWAIFATGLAGPAVLWQPFVQEQVGSDRMLKGVGYLVMGIPGMLSLLWAYLSDTVPLRGTRRDGHLLVAALLSIVGWAAAPFVPRALAPLLAVGLVLGLGATLTRVAAQGALVEIGRRLRSAGRLAAALVGLNGAAGLATVPLTGELNQRPLGWTAGVGVALALSIVLIVAKRSPRDAQSLSPAVDGNSATKIRLSIYLRSRTFWAVLITGCLSSVGGSVLWRTIATTRNAVALSEASVRQIEIFAEVAFIAGAAMYAFCAGRVKPRNLVRAALVAQALGLVLLVGVQEGDALQGLVLAVASRGLGGLGVVAVVDLAMRVAPRGREAFGYVLLTSVPMAFGSMPFGFAFSRLTIPALVLGAAGFAVLAAFAVALVPEPLLDVRDGHIS